MTVGNEPLSGTWPGLIFLEQTLRLAAESNTTPLAVISTVSEKVATLLVLDSLSSYLYSDENIDAELLPALNVVELLAIEVAVTKRLAEFSIFKSPQVHYGKIFEVINNINIANPLDASVLPVGALWTAVHFGKDSGDDSWYLYQGVGGLKSKNRTLLHFNAHSGRNYTVDGWHDWVRLIDEHPRLWESKLYPDWPAIAVDYDVVFVSMLGLLLAHPPMLTSAPGSDRRAVGYSLYPGVSDFSTPSAAWMRSSAISVAVSSA
ncbi:hypothetical protein [Rhodococcus sp. 1168]|uniref:hypothetical protein n=1 Tax=Rhodococcus sp. 1168 TaxID=2018041 RepID=UPI000F74197A|nr:hypothetical protein [Rhodococcus sp. 1168]